MPRSRRERELRSKEAVSEFLGSLSPDDELLLLSLIYGSPRLKELSFVDFCRSFLPRTYPALDEVDPAVGEGESHAI